MNPTTGDEETSSLLDSSSISEDDAPEDGVTSNHPEPPRRYIPIEPIMCLYLMAIGVTQPVYQFYVYGYIAKAKGIPDFVQSDAQEDKCKGNTSSVVIDIQQEAASVFQALSFCQTFPAIIPTLFLGSIADKFGRKTSLLISMSGAFIKLVLFVVVMQLELSFTLLFVGNAIEGLCGFFGAALMSAFSILADITKPGNERAFRISLIEGLVAASVGLAIFGGGFWIKYNGFVIPMIAAALACLVGIALVIVFIPKTNHFTNGSGDRKIVSWENIKRCFVFYYKDTPDKRRLKLIILQVIMVFTVGPVLGRTNVMTLYLLNAPLCWSAIHVNVFNAAMIVLCWALTIGILKILQRITNDVGVLVIGSVFGAGSYLVLSFATEDWIVYLYAVLSVLSVAAIPMVRSIMSRLVAPGEQGALFAGISSMEVLFNTICTILFTQVYKLTVSSFSGAVFTLFAGFLFVSLTFSCCLVVVTRNEKSRIIQRKKATGNSHLRSV